VPHSSRRRSIARHGSRLQAANRSQCYCIAVGNFLLSAGSLDLINQKPKLVCKPLPASGDEPAAQFAIDPEGHVVGLVKD